MIKKPAISNAVRSRSGQALSGQALSESRSAPVKHQISKLFWVISPAFTRWAELHMHEKGLTPQRIRMMIPLLENGPMMMSALRDELGVSASSITALVDVLEKEKMVSRKAHKNDRRATMIAITPKAEKLIRENCDIFRDRVGELFSGLSKAKQEQLLGLLLDVREALIERNILEDSEFSCHSYGKAPDA